MPESGDSKAFSPFGGGKGKGKGKGGMGGLLAGIGAGSQLKKTVVKVREKIEVKKTGAAAWKCTRPRVDLVLTAARATS